MRNDIDKSEYGSFLLLEKGSDRKRLTRLLIVLGIILVIVLFVPWTQNIMSRGEITTLYPDQRPQTINSVIAGRIDKWFIKEGDLVSRGDTLVRISEVKEDYLDPDLLERVKQQIDAKAAAVNSYNEKVKALEAQITALESARVLKLNQIENKIRQSELKVMTDSMDMVAYQVALEVATQQFDRMKELYNEGLKSLTEFESRQTRFQKASAEYMSGKNKYLGSKNELEIVKVEYHSIEAKYRDDIAKSNSEKYSALSARFDAESSLAKLKNQFSNYEVRSGYYIIKAPSDGYITRIFYNGTGETLKEGQELLSIMPLQYNLAVELYVKPIDIPLLEAGQEVRIQFDGWPAIVFSGWPNTSYGTYGGKIYAIDKFISPNGKFRVLVSPDTNDQHWPKALNVGAGTRNMILLKDVPIWYELWRQINGFPPDYYKTVNTNDKK